MKLSSPRYKYAIVDGQLWRFRTQEFVKMLKLIAQGHVISHEIFGDLLAPEVKNITDLSRQQAEEMLFDDF